MQNATLILALTALSLCLQLRPAAALLIPSQAASAEPEAVQRVQDLQTIQHVLELKVLRQRLADLGFSADEIAAKLTALPDEQVHDLVQQIESVMVGGFHGTDDLLHGGLFSILVIAAIVLLVLLLI
jgi:hypothetical protein